MSKKWLLTALFWLVLAAFFVWDWHYSDTINIFDEPSIAALGSGQAPSGAHCASTF